MNKLYVTSVAYCEIHVLHVFYRGPETRAYRIKSPGLIT